MPITKSAKKAYRSSERKKVFNLRRKTKITLARRQITKQLKTEDIAVTDLQDNLNKYFSALDKAAKTKFIHKNKASRLKSRMVKKIAQATKAE